MSTEHPSFPELFCLDERVTEQDWDGNWNHGRSDGMAMSYSLVRFGLSPMAPHVSAMLEAR